MRVTTMLYLSPQHTTCLVFMNPCASLTKQKHCTRTYSGNIQTMSTVSLKQCRYMVMYGVAYSRILIFRASKGNIKLFEIAEAQNNGVGIFFLENLR